MAKNTENISAKECIALQKALDSTLFSGFEGAIRHLWSVIWPDCQRPTVMQLHRKSGKKFTLLRALFRSEWWGNYQQNKISKINFPFFEYILEQTSSEKLWIVYYFKIKFKIGNRNLSCLCYGIAGQWFFQSKTFNSNWYNFGL